MPRAIDAGACTVVMRENGRHNGGGQNHPKLVILRDFGLPQFRE